MGVKKALVVTMLLVFLFLFCGCIQEEREYITVEDLSDRCYDFSGSACSLEIIEEIAREAENKNWEDISAVFTKYEIIISDFYQKMVSDYLMDRYAEPSLIEIDGQIERTEIICPENSQYLILRLSGWIVHSLNGWITYKEGNIVDYREVSVDIYFLIGEKYLPQYAKIFYAYRYDPMIEYYSMGSKTWALVTVIDSSGTGFIVYKTRWFCVEDRTQKLEYRFSLKESDESFVYSNEYFSCEVMDFSLKEQPEDAFQLELNVKVTLKIVNYNESLDSDVRLGPLEETHTIVLTYDPKKGAFYVEDAPLGFFLAEASDSLHGGSDGMSRGLRYKLLKTQLESLPENTDPYIKVVVDEYREEWEKLDSTK